MFKSHHWVIWALVLLLASPWAVFAQNRRRDDEEGDERPRPKKGAVRPGGGAVPPGAGGQVIPGQGNLPPGVRNPVGGALPPGGVSAANPGAAPGAPPGAQPANKAAPKSFLERLAETAKQLTAKSAPGASTDAVNGAIQKGIGRLWDDQDEDEGTWAYGDSEDRKLGMTALAALSLYENGVLPSEPRLKKALDHLREKSLNNTDTYSVSLAAIVLARVGLREDRSLVRSLAAKLVAGQHMTGGWGYTVPVLTAEQEREPQLRKQPEVDLGDLSVTQFAVVALWQAQRVNARVEDAFRQTRLRLAWAQTKDGGWNYPGIPDSPSSPSMTAAGTYMWLVTSAWEVQEAKRRGRDKVVPVPPRSRSDSVKDRLKRRLSDAKDDQRSKIQEQLDKAKENRPNDIYDALQRAAIIKKEAMNTASGAGKPFPDGDEEGQVEFKYKDVLPPVLDAKVPNPLVSDEPLKRALALLNQQVPASINYLDTLYYIWSVERLGVLLGTDHFGSVHWFNAGAENLVKSQKEDGHWGIDAEADQQTHYKYGPDTCFALLFLRKANLGSDVTRMLNSDPSSPFSIAEKAGSKFKTLDEALAQASEGQTIVITGEGPYPMAGVTIEKSLTIRAAHGYKPVLRYERPKNQFGFDVDIQNEPSARHLFIIKAKTITMEGLHLVMDPPRGVTAEWSMIRCEGAEPRLLNCSITETTGRSTVGIDLVNSSRAFFRNSLFAGCSPMIRVESSKSGNLMLRDCVCYTNRVLDCTGSGELNLWLVESTVHADSVLDLGGFNGAANVVAENNIIRAQRIIQKLGEGERTWDGQMNLYDNRLWIGEMPKKSVRVEDLAGWRKFFDAEEYRSRQSAAPFAVYKPQLGPFRHDHDPQEWATDDTKLQSAMRLTGQDQIGANVYEVGAGVGYLQFSDRTEYSQWFRADLPSQRNVQASAK